jgi:catechol 2,3-dioxygenase-like lactoylglutathione lyase family enzyme
MRNLSRIYSRFDRRAGERPKLLTKIKLTAAIVALLGGAAAEIGAQDAPKPSAPPKDQFRSSIRIKLTSVYVDDQDKALKFYTEVLGFVKKRDIPVGKAKWLTVVSPDEPDGTELLLEPSDNPATRTFKKAVFEQGIPFTAFGVDDLQQTYERLKKLGVVFSVTPTNTGMAKIAVFDDTCGNLIQLFQVVQK